MTVTVNKAALVDLMSARMEMSKADIERAITAFTDVITDVVAGGDSVTLKGFGTFEPRRKAEKTISNGITGKPVVVPAHTVPAFRPGSSFKDKVKDA